MARPPQMTDETILDALDTRPEATAADLAEVLGIGQSTAAKRLAALETAGSVRRTPGGREAGRRVADRWVVAYRSPSPRAAEAPGHAPEGVHHCPAAGREHAEGENDDGHEAAVSATSAPESGRRLGRGELGSLVRDYLAARPDESFGPAAVGRALGRSQGAISNLCGSSLSSATVEEVAGAVGVSRSAASKVLADLEREGQVARVAGGREGGRRLPDRWRLAVNESDEGTGRLGRGQLRELVVDYLRAHPGEVSPAQLSKTLGHSAGAISNVLAKLAGGDEVVQTSERPRRYAARPVS